MRRSASCRVVAQAFKGSEGAEQSVDQFTVVVPMKPDLNRGAGSPWRASEAKTIKWAKQFGFVTVHLEPIDDANPPQLVDGTPIPKAINTSGQMRAFFATSGTNSVAPPSAESRRPASRNW